MIKLPDYFSEIRIKKAKLWIERVMLDKPGMKEAKTCGVILDFIDEVQRLNATAQPFRENTDSTTEYFRDIEETTTNAQPVSDGLYRIANHIAGAKNSLPQEWQDWAEEIESDLRKLAAAPGGKDV